MSLYEVMPKPRSRQSTPGSSRVLPRHGTQRGEPKEPLPLGAGCKRGAPSEVLTSGFADVDVANLEEVTEQLSRTEERLQCVSERKRALLAERRCHGRAPRSRGMTAMSYSSSAPSLGLGPLQDPCGDSQSPSVPSRPSTRHDTRSKGSASSLAALPANGLPKWLTGAPGLPPSPEWQHHGGQISMLSSVRWRAAAALKPVGTPTEGRTSRPGTPLALAAIAARGFVQNVGRTVSRRVLAREGARRLLASVQGDQEGPVRICIFFGPESPVAALEDLATSLALAIAPLGERALVMVAGEPSQLAAFGTAYGETSPGTPLWMVLPQYRRTPPGGVGQEVHAGPTDAVCRDVFAQLGDIYVTLEAGPDVEKVAGAAVARGACLVPLATDARGLGLLRMPLRHHKERLFFTSLEALKQLDRGGLGAAEAASLTAAALDAFLCAHEALQSPDAGAIEFEIGGLRYGAKLVESSALITPGLSGATHLLAYYQRPFGDTRVEWVALDESSRRLSDSYGHEDIPYRVVHWPPPDAEVCSTASASEQGAAAAKTTRMSVRDMQRSLTKSKERARSPRMIRSPRPAVAEESPEEEEAAEMEAAISSAETAIDEHDFDPQAMKVFKRLAVQGEMPDAHLPEACSLLGHWLINEEWIDELVSSKFNGRAFLDRKEFVVFARDYDALFRRCMRQRFDAVDTNRVGAITPEEIAKFLQSQGVTPSKGVVEELSAEARGKRGKDEKFGIDIFTDLNRIILERAGFTKSEADQLRKELLDRYPSLASTDLDELGAKQLHMSMHWLGYPQSFKPKEALDQGDRAALGEAGSEFLLLMRAQRERWVEMARQAFKCLLDERRSANSATGHLEVVELQELLQQMGFVALLDAVQEAVQDCELGGRPAVAFEEAFEVVETFRRKEGFMREELEDIVQCYRDAGGESAALTGLQLSGALREAGWRQRVPEVQDIIVDFDLDGDEAICEVEFVKIARKLREDLVRGLRKHYDDNHLHRPDKISQDELRMAVIKYLGYVPSDRQVRQVWQQHRRNSRPGEDAWNSWLRLVLAYWKAERDKRRENQGFSEEEVYKFHVRFVRHDANGTGVVMVGDKHLTPLLDEVFPDMRSNPEEHQRATEWLAELEQRNNGAIDFAEFLRIMRRIQNGADEEKVYDEEEARESAGLSRAEVKDFRALFSVFDNDGSGQMSYGELTDLLGSLTKIDNSASGALRAALAAVDDDGNRELSFPEFLRLMKKLQSENWNGINSAAAERNRIACCLEEVQRFSVTRTRAHGSQAAPQTRRSTTRDWKAFVEEHAASQPVSPTRP